MSTMLNNVAVNPTIVFLGLVLLIIAAGVGEGFHVLPSGTAATLIGVLVGTGVYHTAVNQNSNTVSKAQNGGSLIVPPSMQSALRFDSQATTPLPAEVPVQETLPEGSGING